MRVLFDGEIWVHYGQAYLESRVEGEDVGLVEAFAGQRNGLCGGASAGFLYLITGLHTGRVGFTVESYNGDGPPPVGEQWQEVVEVSFTPASSQIGVVEWGGQDYHELDLAVVDHCVRYCASGMDEARAVDTRSESEPCVDRYLLQFWPAPPRRDEVIRQTGKTAAYWHGHARSLPSREQLAAQKSEAERRARQAEQRAGEERERQIEEIRWGGRLPSEKLRSAGGNARNVAKLDRDLAEAVANADPDTQRAVARWAARRAYTLAGLADIAWIAPALTALDRGADLPAPFEDRRRVFDLLLGDPEAPRTLVASLDRRLSNLRQQAMAVPALYGAIRPDPLGAAFDALYHAAVTHGPDDYPGLYADARRAFPALNTKPCEP